MQRSVCSLLAFALMGGSAFAQTSAGALVGLVRDPAAAAIPRAAVTVTNTQTNVSSHLDLAICRLEDALGMPENAPGLQTELAEALQTVPFESKPVLVWEQP